MKIFTQRHSPWMLVCLLVLGVSGCSPVLPQKTVEIDALVPVVPVEETTQAVDVTREAETMFPGRCEWHALEAVVDGDTILVTNGQRVRLIGVDTPEVAGPYTEEEPGGRAASDFVVGLLGAAEEVCLVFDRVGDEVDIYDRWLAYVYTSEGVEVNAEIIRSGVGRVYTRYPFEKREEYRGLVE